MEIIVPDDRELGFHISLRVFVGNLPGLDEGAELFLAVFEPDRDVRRTFEPPEEIEIVTVALVPVRVGDGPVEAISALELERRHRNPRSWTIWIPAEALGKRLFNSRRGDRQLKQLRFAKLKIVAQGNRERIYRG